MICVKAVKVIRFAATAADVWPRLSQKVSKCCHLLSTLGLKAIAHVGYVTPAPGRNNTPPPAEPKEKTKAVELNMGGLIVLLTLSL